ncbi:MAG: hypothetical protein M0Q13_15345 [Methanothrix sp.]|jgi:hypothetical protein|nr:hypothetical protein [Methanothrix sp.]
MDSIVFEKVLEDGTIEYCNEEGELHRNNDLPAVIKVNGTQLWYQNGVQYELSR